MDALPDDILFLIVRDHGLSEADAVCWALAWPHRLVAGGIVNARRAAALTAAMATGTYSQLAAILYAMGDVRGARDNQALWDGYWRTPAAALFRLLSVFAPPEVEHRHRAWLAARFNVCDNIQGFPKLSYLSSPDLTHAIERALRRREPRVTIRIPYSRDNCITVNNTRLLLGRGYKRCTTLLVTDNYRDTSECDMYLMNMVQDLLDDNRGVVGFELAAPKVVFHLSQVMMMEAKTPGENECVIDIQECYD